MNGREVLFLARAFSTAFRKAGYSHAYHFLYPAGARLLRKLPGRTNWTLTLEVDGKEQTFFLKRHAPCRFGVPPGVREWTHHQLLEDHGIPVPRPAAAGQEIQGASFFCSAEVPGAVSLEVHLSRAKNRDRGVVARLAAMVRKLHDIPVCHRDLYLCHLFIQPGAGDLILLDLQRLIGQPGGPMRRRWKVKDLAALLHSSHLEGVTRTDRVRFLLRYLGKDRLDGEARTWARRVRCKARKMARHVPRFDGRGRARK